MNNRISLYTFGCRLNQSETAVIENSFKTKGYRIVELNDNPDIVVVNTCTVTENGDADTRRLVNKINRLNPNVLIALVGCQAQIQKNKLAQLPNVRWIVGNARKMELASIIHERNLFDGVRIIAPPVPRESFTVPATGTDRHHTRANLKVQDGCDFFCTFCEIPFARGRARSRVFDDIVREAEALAQNGYRELILTGINLGTYRDEDKEILHFLDALEEISGIERIRISSIEPTTVPFSLIERMGRTKLCRYLHIPLQSASEKILKGMRRKYTAEEFKDFILKTHQAVPEICIGTDIIVGFPEETDELFEETVSFVRDLPFSYVHVFSYSDRTYNKSRFFKNKVSFETIQTRSQKLRQLSMSKKQLFLERRIDTTQRVLFEEKKNGFWTGLTDNYIRVNVKTDQFIKNQIRQCRLRELQGLTVNGVMS